MTSGYGYAEEDTVKAMSPWKGVGFAFPVGPDQVYMVAVYSGVMLVDDGKGPIHAASIVCPGTVDADLKKGTKTGYAKCVITGEAGQSCLCRIQLHRRCGRLPGDCLRSPAARASLQALRARAR